MLSSRPRPTPEEAALLDDLAAREAAMRGGGWRLENRQLRQRVFRGDALANIFWLDVDVPQGLMEDVTITGSTFTGVTFDDIDWKNVTAEGVTFTRCLFNKARMEEVKLTHCAFRGCRFEDVQLDAAILEDCNFEDHLDRTVSWDRPSFKNVAYLRATLDGVRMGGGRLENVQATQGSVRLRLTDVELRAAGLRDLELKGMDLDHARVDGLTLERVRGGNVRLGDSQLAHVHLLRCDGLVQLSAVATTLGDLQIRDCPRVLSIPMLGCEVSSFSITRSSVSLLSARDTTFNGPCRIASSSFEGVELDGCRVNDLTLRDSQIGSSLDVSGSVFTRCTYDGMGYRPGLRFVDAGAQYRDTQPLPRPE